MHPEIRKFFEIGNRFIISWTHNKEHVHFYDKEGCISISSNEENVLAWGEPNKLKYKLNGEWHSEDKMLRIIKLKAFL
jgi:hypothetical protein